MRRSRRHAVFFAATFVLSVYAAPSEKWPYWPDYSKTPLAEVRPQQWRTTDDVIDGWDWSLPPGVKPAPNGLMAVQRSSSLHRPLTTLLEPLDLPMNPAVTLWVKWRDLEPEEGVYKFDVLKERIAEADAAGYFVVLRILSSATGFAPDWIRQYGIPIREEHKESKMTNYEVSHPTFHERYLRLIGALGKSGIPQMDMLKGAFLGYASPSYGDEGIGPHGVDPDTVPHVIERLDAWARTFRGVEHKVFMGGVSQHGLGHGFGIRRGFVEMYLYHIPDETIGQTVDENGYLWVDDSADVLKRNIFHGEENEEYEEKWASEEREFRFGLTTESYPYRYFTSNLRLLQMRCNYVLYNSFSLWPEQMVWVGQSLGRTVDDAPDVWCALRESYVRRVGPVKNFERWLYQRDSEGFETEPAVPVDQPPISMWMVAPDRYYDFVARRGRRIGLSVDDRWCGGKPVDVAVKTTYFDIGEGALELMVGSQRRTLALTGSGELKTATFFIEQADFSAPGMEYDLVFQGLETDAVISFVRVIRLDEH